MGVRVTSLSSLWLVLALFLTAPFLRLTLAQQPTDRALQEAQKLDEEFQTLYQTGKYTEALVQGERVIALRERVLGLEHPMLASTLLLVGLLHRDQGHYPKAETLLRRALTIQEKAVGENHPDFIGCLFNLAIVCRIKGDFEVAESLYRRTLALSEKVHGAESLELTGLLQELAVLHTDRGDFAKAEPLFQRVLAIREKVQGKEHPDVAGCLFNLAILHRNKGDYRKAEPLFQRTLTIQEKTLGAEHPEVANTLFNWAILYRVNGDLGNAEPLLLRALAMQEKRFGLEHPEVTGTLNELAVLYTDKNDFVRAEPIFQRLLGFREKTVGAAHYDVATTLNDLAALYFRQGAYAKAEPLFQRALTILEKTFGAEHRAVSILLGRQARLYEAMGDVSLAVKSQARASHISEHILALNLAVGSEAQKRAAVNALAYELDLTLSLHLNSAPGNAAARDLALTDLLRRKGRAVEAMSDSFGALRARADTQGRMWLDQLLAVRSQLAGLLLSTPPNLTTQRQQIRDLEDQLETLEAKISERSAEFRVQAQPITIPAIQALLPADAALLEFAVYHPFDVKLSKYREAHYVVYLLGQTGAAQWVELGEARIIDNAVQALRKALRNPQTLGTLRIARALDELLLRPLRPLLGDAKHLLISPDGALNLIPFVALVDEQNKYLLERFTITYLTSGRDLLRLQVPHESRSEAVIVADPEFGAPLLVYDKKQARLDESSVFFESLPGAKSELRGLRELLPESLVLSREQATETALKRVRAPRILHIATHGFFMQAEEREAAPVAPSRKRKAAAGPSTRLAKLTLHIADPMLRSGLALAGANQGKSDKDDGVLTALEVVGLDLWGTKLVALSACDTGVGEVRNGEGVYGLRRALVLAGAESQLMSLWPVADRGTRDLMIGYYKALLQGQARGESLRQVQLQMLRSREHQHPFYWASFIQSGEWANLAGKR